MTEDSHFICEKCIEDEKTFQNCIELGKEFKQTVKLNEFLCFAFSVEEIEKTLIEKLMQDDSKTRELVENYCENDLDFYIGWLVNK